MNTKEKSIFLVYCASLCELLIEAIDLAGNNHLFKQDLKMIANRFRKQLLAKIDILYSVNTDNAISEEAEMQFYDFTNLLETQIKLILHMNKKEREKLITLLSKVQDRISYEKEKNKLFL